MPREVMMSDVLDRLAQEAFERLLREAVGIIHYVAAGKVMKRELAAKYGINEEDVKVEMSRAALEACRRISQIKRLKRS